MKYNKKQKGFTLVELLVAMTIFVVFMGIVINSYTQIVRAQHLANEYRVLYGEARTVFETVVEEFREGMVDYGISYQRCDNKIIFNNAVDNLYLVSKDGITKKHFQFVKPDPYDEESYGKVQLAEKQLLESQLNDPVFLLSFANDDYVDLNSSEVNVEEFHFFVSPAVDPYNQEFFSDGVYRFHPKVTVYALFSKKLSNGKEYKMDLQTTVSSRIYNQVYSFECNPYDDFTL